MFNKSLFPFKSHFLKIKKFKYHYISEGEGEPVLMLHGNPTWSFYFRHLISALRQDYHVIVPDHIGCGLSDKPEAGEYSFTLKQRIEDLEELIAYLQIKGKITLVLHDWGGMIGMAFAVRNYNLISRLIITNTAAFHLPETQSFPFILKLCRDFRIGTFLVCGLNAFSKGAVKLACCRKMPKEIKKAYLFPYNSWHNRQAIIKFIKDIPLTETDISFNIVTHTQKNLYRFNKLPAMIIWGMQDFIFNEHFLDKWQQHLPEAEVNCIEKAGHYLLEDAHEEIIPLVKQFLLSSPI